MGGDVVLASNFKNKIRVIDRSKVLCKNAKNFLVILIAYQLYQAQITALTNMV